MNTETAKFDEPRQPQSRPPLLTEGILLAAVSATAYLFAFMREYGFATYFGVPFNLVSIGPSDVFVTGAFLLVPTLLIVACVEAAFWTSHRFRCGQAVLILAPVIVVVAVDALLYGSRWQMWWTQPLCGLGIGLALLFYVALEQTLEGAKEAVRAALKRLPVDDLVKQIQPRGGVDPPPAVNRAQLEEMLTLAGTEICRLFDDGPIAKSVQSPLYNVLIKNDATSLIAICLSLGCFVSYNVGRSAAYRTDTFLVYGDNPGRAVLRVNSGDIICADVAKPQGRVNRQYYVIPKSDLRTKPLHAERIGRLATDP